jgi:hypothetical protein
MQHRPGLPDVRPGDLPTNGTPTPGPEGKAVSPALIDAGGTLSPDIAGRRRSPPAPDKGVTGAIQTAPNEVVVPLGNRAPQGPASEPPRPASPGGDASGASGG